MPHLIIHYAQDLARDEQVHQMLDSIHAAAFSTGLFDETHIRVRAFPVAFYRVGGGRGPFIHAQLRILPGRSEPQKETLSAAVLAAIRGEGWGAKVITVEVVDMDGNSYAKHTAE